MKFVHYYRRHWVHACVRACVQCAMLQVASKSDGHGVAATTSFAWRDTPGARRAREDTRPDSIHPINRIYIPVHSLRTFCAVFLSFLQNKMTQFREGISIEIEISTYCDSLHKFRASCIFHTLFTQNLEFYVLSVHRLLKNCGKSKKRGLLALLILRSTKFCENLTYLTKVKDEWSQSLREPHSNVSCDLLSVNLLQVFVPKTPFWNFSDICSRTSFDTCLIPFDAMQLLNLLSSSFIRVKFSNRSWRIVVIVKVNVKRNKSRAHYFEATVDG